MRWAAPAAVVLLVTLVTPIQAAPRTPMVTGDYAYAYAGHISRVQVSGRAGDPPTGWVTYAGDFATFAGPVTCVNVIGSDAWLAGPITAGSSGFEGFDGWAVRVHDGGTPGRNGDTAITFIDTPESAAEICASGTTDYDTFTVPVVSGNLVVHRAD